MASVLVALAITGSRPIQSNAGNEMSDPPPATELTAPARKAAPMMMTVFKTFKIFQRARRCQGRSYLSQRRGLTKHTPAEGTVGRPSVAAPFQTPIGSLAAPFQAVIDSVTPSFKQLSARY
jgi:hypothetical protein